MLYLVGSGVDFSFTQKGVELMRNAEEVFVDAYTNLFPKEFEEKMKKEWKAKFVQREFIEGNSLLELAKKKNVALVVIGDIFFATTHISLYHEARGKGIKCEIAPNSSILSWMGKIGFQLYKFGRTITIPNTKMNVTSFYDYLVKNKEIGLHTLMLADISLGSFPFEKAREKVLEVDKKRIFEKEKVVVISRAGWKDEKVLYGKLEEIEKIKEPYSIVLPGKLHFYEEEVISSYEI